MIRSMLKTRIQRVRDDFHSHPRAFWLAPALTAFGLAVTGTGVSANQQTPRQPVQTTPPQAQETQSSNANITNQNLVTRWNTSQASVSPASSASNTTSSATANLQTAPSDANENDNHAIVMHQLTLTPTGHRYTTHLLLGAKKPSAPAKKSSPGNGNLPSKIRMDASTLGPETAPGQQGFYDDATEKISGVSGSPSAFCNGWNQNGPAAGGPLYLIGQPPAAQQKALVYAVQHGYSHIVQNLICWMKSSEGSNEDVSENHLLTHKVPKKFVDQAKDALNNSGSTDTSGYQFGVYSDKAHDNTQSITVFRKVGKGKNNTNTTGGGGTTSSSTSTSTSGSCGGGAAAAAAGGGAGGPAAGGAAAGGDAAGGAAAGGAATVAGAGGGTNGTAGGVVGGGEGNNDSDPYGPNNNNVISGHGTDDNNNNPVNNNVVPEVPLVNNNDHEVNNIAENKQFDHESKDIAGVIDTMNATPTHAYQLAKLVNSDKNDSLNQQEADYQENNDLQYSLAAQNAGLANQADVQAIYQSGRAELQSLKDQHAEMDLQSMAAASNSANGLEQTSEDSGQNDPLASFKQTLDQLNVNGQNSVSSQNLTNGLPGFQQTHRMTNNAAHSQLKLAPQRVSHQSRLASGVNVKTDDIAGIAFAFGMLLIALAVADEKYRRKYQDG